MEVVSKDDLKKIFKELKTDIEPKIQEFNSRKGSFQMEELTVRLASSGFNPGEYDIDKLAAFLGAADLVGRIQDSNFYYLLVDYLEGKEFSVDEPFYLEDKDDFWKLSYIKHRGYMEKSKFPFEVFPLEVYKETAESDAPFSFGVLLIDKDFKAKLSGFSKIMKGLYQTN